jgi:hypothetical protein
MLLQAFQILPLRQMFREICNTIKWFVAGVDIWQGGYINNFLQPAQQNRN